VSFQEAVTTCLTQKYADFSGRARRSEYWFFYLATLIASVVVQIITRVIHLPFLYYIFVLALFIPSLAAGVRRLHDTGRSGWWLLIAIIPLVGWIVLIVFLATDSEPSTNAYGPSPKGVEGQFNQSGA
jgi:uncharacterized membrane protein YhaH (DUF805 family)